MVKTEEQLRKAAEAVRRHRARYYKEVRAYDNARLSKFRLGKKHEILKAREIRNKRLEREDKFGRSEQYRNLKPGIDLTVMPEGEAGRARCQNESAY